MEIGIQILSISLVAITLPLLAMWYGLMDRMDKIDSALKEINGKLEKICQK